jgi:hypothetical protein
LNNERKAHSFTITVELTDESHPINPKVSIPDVAMHSSSKSEKPHRLISNRQSAARMEHKIVQHALFLFIFDLCMKEFLIVTEDVFSEKTKKIKPESTP